MFKIGEFSKIARVSGRLLRYYDEIGLLQPIEIDEFTGYRYYSATQLPRLNRILALKDLGLSLDQIRRMLDDNVSPDEIRGMLLMKQAQVEQAVRDELDRFQHIEIRLAQLEGQTPEMDVILKSVPAQTYLAVDYHCPFVQDGMGLMFEMARQIPKRIGQENLDSFALVFRSEFFEAEDFDVQMGYLLQKKQVEEFALQSGHQLSVRALPAAETVATLVNVGYGYGNHLCYSTLGDWIETNGYQLNGEGRELIHQMPSPGHPEEMVMEIQMPIEKVDMGTPLLPSMRT